MDGVVAGTSFLATVIGGALKKPNPPTPTASLGLGITGRAHDSKRHRDAGEPPAVRKAKILVVDEDPALRRVMVSRLGAANYAVDTVGGAQAALDSCVLARPHLVITDLHLKDTDGLAFLRELRSRWPHVSVIVLTAHGSISEAVQATQFGAFGYLVKPVDKEELLGQVERATAVSSFALPEGDWRASFASRSQLMEERLRFANQAAGSDVPVVLTGENGTGKELLARAIHAASARRDKAFVAISCANPHHHALECELFGEESGDAAAPQGGAMRRAQGGTLLLDEIAELPLNLQAVLSAALANPAARWNGRLISTTSRDLKPLADAGAFLRNLFYQINILPIEIPPLGRRREDIPLLVSHFLQQATEHGGRKKIYSPKAIELLATTDWPGNVRQLFDLVKQNVALSRGEVMTKEFVQKSLGNDMVKIPTYAEAREKFARDYLAENLQRAAGNVTQAARLAKRSRTDFYKLLARYRLQPEDFKTADGASPRDRTRDGND